MSATFQFTGSWQLAAPNSRLQAARITGTEKRMSPLGASADFGKAANDVRFNLTNRHRWTAASRQLWADIVAKVRWSARASASRNGNQNYTAGPGDDTLDFTFLNNLLTLSGAGYGVNYANQGGADRVTGTNFDDSRGCSNGTSQYGFPT